MMEHMDNEMQRAIALADRVLDRPDADPDDDLAVLARQFLRAMERLGEYDPNRRARHAVRLAIVGIIIVVVLLLVLIGIVGPFGYGYGYGHAGFGGVGTILVILLILALLLPVTHGQLPEAPPRGCEALLAIWLHQPG